MEREEFNGRQLADMLMKVNGEIEPTGNDDADDERSENLGRLLDVMDVLLDEIQIVATEKKSKNVVLQAKAFNWISETSDWLDDIVGGKVLRK